MKDEWKDVEGFESKYKINRLGEVFNKETGKNLTASVDKCNGYAKYNLYINGENHTCLAHRLVACAFIPNPENLPQIHHKDGNKQNNTVDNLEWVSRKTHGEKMLPEQKQKFRETYQNNLKKRKNQQKFSKCN